jgi:tetratricopeptide (TPR) repeat protein
VRGARAAGAALAAAWIGLALGAAPAQAQHEEHGGDSEIALTGLASKALLTRPIALRPEYGTLRQRVSTPSAEAQAYYDQGFALLASYAWVEAARSFHEALRRDPGLALAHAGLARALVRIDAVPEGRDHLKQAIALAARPEAGGRPAVTPRERAWIRVLELQLAAADAAEGARDAARRVYRTAIDELITGDPADPHGWVQGGLATERGIWAIGQGGGLEAIAFYEAALARDPDHIGAQHFLVHAWENLGRHDKAAEHGATYARAVPGVAHAQHMFAHVLPRLGRWEEARAQLVKADAIERAHYAAEQIAAEEDWHHGHNLHLLGMTELRLGHAQRAEALLRRAAALHTRGALNGYYAAPLLEFLLRQGRIDEALVEARRLAARPAPMAAAVAAIFEGEALLRLARVDEARAAQRRAEAAVTRLAGAVALPASYDPRWRVQPSLDSLAAMLDLAAGDVEGGERALLARADEVARSPHLDAWAEGLVWLERMVTLARQLGRQPLAEQLLARLPRIDPTYRSPIAVGSPQP